ncbi:hypothetical protein [Streptomyces violascens]|uniref:hypothetical protein n=1 Tax=Streptomyces violascens TaxID=67381 RepID=UPI00167A3C67|nr:hypothetical protein [Streptomyces violascens]
MAVDRLGGGVCQSSRLAAWRRRGGTRFAACRITHGTVRVHCELVGFSVGNCGIQLFLRGLDVMRKPIQGCADQPAFSLGVLKIFYQLLNLPDRRGRSITEKGLMHSGDDSIGQIVPGSARPVADGSVTVRGLREFVRFQLA